MSARGDTAVRAWLNALNAWDRARLATVDALLALLHRINRKGGA